MKSKLVVSPLGYGGVYTKTVWARKKQPYLKHYKCLGRRLKNK